MTASISNASYLEYMDWNDDIWVAPVIPKQGMVAPSEAPGHGLAFRPEIVRSYRVGGREMTA